MREHIYNADGQLATVVAYDLDAGTVTVTNTGQSPTVAPVAPSLLSALIADREADQRRARLDQAAATLRAWAVDANATTVTSNAQNVIVMNTVLDRLAVFFDRFADLLDDRK